MSFNSEELEKVKILVVDDHLLFAEGTVALLSFEPRILVVGIAKNGISCLDFFSKTEIDVVLLDIQLPDICGTDLIDEIKKVQPKVKILMMTGHNPKGYVTKSLSKGANGFLLKECSVKELIQGILTVYDGEVYLSQGLENLLQSKNNDNNVHIPVNYEKKPCNLLTPREIEIIELVSQGFRSKEIALVTGINVRTVDFHVRNIFLKLKVNTRLEAVLRYKDEGFSNC
ncbi:histidine kinase [Desulfosporosinus sp. Tol-M]|nr:histidine kinase [Desulfosporosinus sp. Tol-M]